MTSPKPTSDLTPDDKLLLLEMHIDPYITPKPEKQQEVIPTRRAGLRGADQL